MTVLFVCVENACRSQMAEGWARKILFDWSAYSAGSRPRRRVDDKAIKVMNEVGIDISGQVSKSFNELPIQEKQFDFVVIMGGNDTCPFVPARKTIRWNIPDPAHKNLERYRQVRNLIRLQVSRLPWHDASGRPNGNGTQDSSPDRGESPLNKMILSVDRDGFLRSTNDEVRGANVRTSDFLVRTSPRTVNDERGTMSDDFSIQPSALSASDAVTGLEYEHLCDQYAG
jgi:protein-tyrosine-phosphatase